MTLPTGTSKTTSLERRPAAGFTLIELIVVLALLAIVLAVGAPSLARFFHGRSLNSETRQVLALTRYGQSCAVSLGVPMILWINPQTGAYGLREQIGFGSNVASRPLGRLSSGTPFVPKNYQLDDRLHFELDPGSRTRNQQATIRFSPDGSIDGNSLSRLVIREENGDGMAVLLSENRLSYEISDNPNARPVSAR
jgi:prepilin-type N-terminal cleavage/methylation domain-containing protein